MANAEELHLLFQYNGYIINTNLHRFHRIEGLSDAFITILSAMCGVVCGLIETNQRQDIVLRDKLKGRALLHVLSYMAGGDSNIILWKQFRL